MILSTTLDGLALNLRIAAIAPRYYPRCVQFSPSASSRISAPVRRSEKERSAARSAKYPSPDESLSAYQARVASAQRLRRLKRAKRLARLALWQGKES